MKRPGFPSSLLATKAAVVVATLVVALASCSPARLDEAAMVLADIDAGARPSALKRSTGRPTRRPVVYRVEDRDRAGDVYLPAAGALAGMVLVPGITRHGKDDPRLVAFAETLARARFEVLVPDLPNLRDLRVDAADARVLADAVAYLDRRRGGQGALAMTGVSYAVGPAVLALFEPGAAGSVDVMLAIGGYYDLEATLTFFTTGYYREAPGAQWRHRTPNAYGKWVFVRSNAGRLDDPGDRALVATMAERKLADPGADVSDLTVRLGPEGRAVHALMVNRDPDRVPALVAALPAGVAADIRRLDLKRRDLASLETRFIVVHGRDDPIIPESESRALAAAVAPGRAELTILDSLNHVDPRPAGLLDKARLLGVIYTLLAIRDRGRAP